MKVIEEIGLSSFEFWAGAKHTAAQLSYGELDMVEEALEEIYPEGLTATQINDLFWFDEDFILKLIGRGDDDE